MCAANDIHYEDAAMPPSAFAAAHDFALDMEELEDTTLPGGEGVQVTRQTRV